MGGKSRKSGGVSKRLINQLTRGRGKGSCGSKKKNKRRKYGFFLGEVEKRNSETKSSD